MSSARLGKSLTAVALLAGCGGGHGGDGARADSARIVANAMAAIRDAWPTPLPHDVAAFTHGSSGYVVDLVPRSRVPMGRYRVQLANSGRVVRWEKVE